MQLGAAILILLAYSLCVCPVASVVKYTGIDTLEYRLLLSYTRMAKGIQTKFTGMECHVQSHHGHKHVSGTK